MCHRLGMRKVGAAQEQWVAVPRAPQGAVPAPAPVLHPPAELGTLLGGEGRGLWQLPPSPSVQEVGETLFKASASVFLKLLLDPFQMNLNWKVLQVPDGAGICKGRSMKGLESQAVSLKRARERKAWQALRGRNQNLLLGGEGGHERSLAKGSRQLQGGSEPSQGCFWPGCAWFAAPEHFGSI